MNRRATHSNCQIWVDQVRTVRQPLTNGTDPCSIGPEAKQELNPYGSGCSLAEWGVNTENSHCPRQRIGFGGIGGSREQESVREERNAREENGVSNLRGRCTDKQG
jgi:hypothetical protein